MKKSLNSVYIVQQGDNIEKIAKKYNISTISILIKNNITPNMIKKGRVLIIP